MNEIKSIYMADNTNVDDIGIGDDFSIKKDKEDNFFIYEILLNGEGTGEIFDTKKEAKEYVKEWATDNGHLIVQGYGTHSGRKFWQLPERIQRQIFKMAGF